MQDVRVRQAMNLAVNRDVIVNNVLGAGQTAAYNFTPVRTLVSTCQICRLPT